MNTLPTWLSDLGPGAVFLNVLIQQLGLPVPTYPTLLVTGALSVGGRHSAFALLGAAVLACLIADLAWYIGGRRYGRPVLRTICRISVSPDGCVRTTESLFARYGIWSLLVAKFIPGFGTLATALSGNLRLPLAAFIAADLVGAALYTGVAITLGVVFHAAVNDVIAVIENLGWIGVWVVAAALALFIAVRWWQRHRLLRELRMNRITVAELQTLLRSEKVPAILDVRSALSRERDGTIPGALAWSLDPTDRVALDIPYDDEVVVYCACPNEVSAAKVARELQRAGFKRVRPLHGGIDAWIAAGHPIDRMLAVEVVPAAA